MTRHISYGVIGCGMMGQEHVRNIALLQDAGVAAVYEPDPLMRQAARQLVPRAVFADTIEDLLAVPALDCLLITSPNHCHLEQLVLVARRRPLPVLVEKPLVIDAAGAACMEKLAAGYPAPLWVAMEYRYMPPVARFLADADAATGGVRMLTIREHRYPFLNKVGAWNRFNRTSGGTFVEKCCHFFDLMRLILKSEPVRVMASAGQAVNHLDERYEGQTPDIWDHGYALVDFANGARAMLELCMFAEGGRYQEEISAVGPNGKIECFVPGPTRFWPPDRGPQPTPQVVVSPRPPQRGSLLAIPVDPELLAVGDHNGSTYYQHKRFVAAVRGSGAVEVTARDGLAAVAMGLAAQRSAAEGRAVAMGPA